MIDNINIGVVGTGKLGTFHIQKLLNISNAKLVGIHDSDKELMRKHAEKYNVNTFDEVDKLIEKCDAITIATPTTEHFNVSKHALENGVHIFIEKPITNTIKEADELIMSAREKIYKD